MKWSATWKPRRKKISLTQDRQTEFLPHCEEILEIELLGFVVDSEW